MLQAPDKFVAAAVRNPVCNLALMVGTTDIPDWCYVEAYGSKGKDSFTEAPPAEQLTLFHSKSPISHLSKVCLMDAWFSLLDSEAYLGLLIKAIRMEKMSYSKINAK